MQPLRSLKWKQTVKKSVEIENVNANTDTSALGQYQHMKSVNQYIGQALIAIYRYLWNSSR